MATARYGPPAGSEGICDGCGEAFTRELRNQKFCSNRCNVMRGPWRYPSLWEARGPKGGTFDRSIGPESR